MQLIYRGEIPELQGTKWDVPSTIPMAGRAAWIESQHREALAREAAAAAKAEADAEAAAREAELLGARIEAARSGEAFRDDLQALSAEIEGVKQQLETPDAEAVMAMNASTMVAFNTAKDVLDRVEVAIAQAESLQLTADEYLKQAEEHKAAALQVLRNQQQMVNGSFEGYSIALEQLQEQTNEVTLEVGQLLSEASAARDDIAEARAVTENLQAQIDALLRQVLDQWKQGIEDQLWGAVNLTLKAVGLRAEEARLTANAAGIDPASDVILTREQLIDAVASLLQSEGVQVAAQRALDKPDAQRNYLQGEAMTQREGLG